MNTISEKVEQITIFLENRPGILADLCAHLADHRINIRAMTTFENADSGAARLVVDRTDAAAASLDEVGVPYERDFCLAIEMANSPGGFAHVARTLALAGVNIDYIYASSLQASGGALGIFGVSDLDKAVGLDWSI